MAHHQRRSDPARIVVAHPSPDVYGSDRQLLESVGGLVGHGWLTTVVLPADGPLRPLLEERGADVRITRFPVLRKALLRPRALLRFLLRAPVDVWGLQALLRRSGASAVYVNTLTIPLWVIAARVAGIPVLCHSHEAEQVARPLQFALAAPLLLAKTVIANSETTRAVLAASVPRLSRRIAVVHNGVPDAGVPTQLRNREAWDPVRLALVSRLSPRKGVHIALEAVAILRAQGLAVTIDVCGTTFPGYEWYERDLEAQVRAQGLSDAVTFHGYVNPTRPLLESADVVLVPSFGESFGNVAVEGMLAGRPVVASDVQGLSEVIDDGRSGLLVRPGSAEELAAAVDSLAKSPAFAARIAASARDEATARFGVDLYQRRIAGQARYVARGGGYRRRRSGTHGPGAGSASGRAPKPR